MSNSKQKTLTQQYLFSSCFCLFSVFFFSFITQELSAQVQGIPLPVDSTVRYGQLSNGLRYYLKRNLKPAGYVELRLALQAGSLQETRSQRGLAHFVEHMAFNGTRNFPKNELIHYLESTGVRFGADLNAYTSFGETVYQLQVRKDSAHLHRGLLVLEDWATGIQFDPAEVQKERGIILAEWRNRLGPNQRLEDQYLKLLYRGSRRFQRMPIGDTAIIKHASAATLQQYYQKWYRPDLMAIVAVGDIDPDSLEQEIIHRFGRIPSFQGPAPKKYSNLVNSQRRAKIYTDADAAFCQAFLYIREPRKNQAPLLPRTYQEMQNWLCRSLYNSMLNRRLIRVQQQSDPPFTFAGLGFGMDWGQNPMFSLTTFTSEQKLRSALAQLWQEVQKARHHHFTSGELLRQKQELLNTLLQQANAQETTHSAAWANQLSTCFIEGAPFSSAQQRYTFTQKLLAKIDLPQIAAMMQSIPRAKNRRVLVLSGSVKNQHQLPSLNGIWRMLDSIEQLPPQAFAPGIEDQLAEQPWVDETLAAQPIVEEKYQQEFEVHEFRLSNGIRVLAKATRLRQDQVLLISSSPGGHSWVPDSLFVNAAYLADLMQQAGMGKFDYVHYQEKLAGKSVTLSPYLNELEEGFSGTCRSTELEDLLALIYLYAVQPRFDTNSVLSFRKRQENVLRNMLSTPYYQFAALKQRLKYGSTPRRDLNRLEDLPLLTSTHLKRIHQERFGDLSDLLVVVVGDFEIEQLKSLAQRYLGNLPAAGRRESWRDLGLDIRKGQIDSISRGGRAPKTLVEYTWHGDFVNSTLERYHFSSMISALQIRLREVLREQEAGIYSLNFTGNVEYHPRPVYRIVLGFNTEPPRADALMAKALACIENFCQNGPDEALLRKVQNTQKENRMKSEQDNSFWLNQLHQRYKEGWTLEGLRIQNYFKLVDGLSTAALQQAAQRYLQGEDRIKVVLVPVTVE